MQISRSRLSIFLVLALAVLVGCAQQPAQPPPPPDTRAADEAAIRAAGTEWAAAITAKDLEKSLSFYADDASVFPPNMPVAADADSRRKLWTDMFAQPDLAVTITTTKVEVAKSSDIAYETGTVQESYKDKRGKAVNVTGKYVVVWKKQASGQWKAIADIFNTDK